MDCHLWSQTGFEYFYSRFHVVVLVFIIIMHMRTISVNFSLENTDIYLPCGFGEIPWQCEYVLQKDGIPTILAGRNTLLTAETGSGKTLAYLLPMMNQILMWQLVLSERQFNSPLGVIVSPNRELANQIGVGSHDL